MVDGDPAKIAEGRRIVGPLNGALEFASLMVTRDNVGDILQLALLRNPDVFSLDIDSMDYHVAAALLDRGFRPKIAIVEYNSAFGPEQAVSIPHEEGFNRHRAHPSGWYYGVSVMGLRRLFEGRGYRFVTVEQNGVNAFFADRTEFDAEFLDALRGAAFRENVVQRRESHMDWAGQLATIRHLPVLEIAAAAT
jgi:hypothetical protein